MTSSLQYDVTQLPRTSRSVSQNPLTVNERQGTSRATTARDVMMGRLSLSARRRGIVRPAYYYFFFLFVVSNNHMLGLYRTASAAPTFAAVASATRRKFMTSGNLKASIDKLKAASPPAAKQVATSGGLLAFPKNHPFAFQLMVATAKTAAADLMVQMVAEKKSFAEVDWKRNGIFVVFGFAYLGGFQWFLMVHKYRQWFPTMDKFAKMSFAEKLKYPAGIIDAGKMVLFDILVHLPLMYFPTYYSVKELVAGETWSPVDWVRDGCSKYGNNFMDDFTAMIQLWGPSDCVQFVLPIHIRMPFRHLVSFFWTAYVSFTRGAIEAVPIAE